MNLPEHFHAQETAANANWIAFVETWQEVFLVQGSLLHRHRLSCVSAASWPLQMFQTSIVNHVLPIGYQCEFFYLTPTYERNYGYQIKGSHWSACNLAACSIDTPQHIKQTSWDCKPESCYQDPPLEPLGLKHFQSTSMYLHTVLRFFHELRGPTARM